MPAIFLRAYLYPGDEDDFHLCSLYRLQSGSSPNHRGAGAVFGMNDETFAPVFFFYLFSAKDFPHVMYR